MKNINNNKKGFLRKETLKKLIFLVSAISTKPNLNYVRFYKKLLYLKK